MINIALAGLGTVGSALYDVLSKDKTFNIKHVLVKNLNKHLDVSNVTDDIDDILNDNNLDLVIEVMGSIDASYKLVKTSLSKGISVITANKALLAIYLAELTNIARLNNADLYFEASCMGAIPVISTINNINKFDTILGFKGIVNGSTNYLLTKSSQSLNIESAIDEAKAKGFLEADPSDDLEGIDVIRKVIILSQISYNASFDITKAYTYPISNITSHFLEFANLLNRKVKYIGESFKLVNDIYLSVEPCLVDEYYDMYHCDNELNQINIRTKLSNTLTLKGYGAGGNPTASAVLLDLNRYLNKDHNRFSFDNKLEFMSEDLVIANYIIESNKNIESDKIKSLGQNFYIAKNISRQELKALLDKIICYARLI